MTTAAPPDQRRESQARSRPKRSGVRLVLHIAFVIAVGLGGAWLGLLVGGRSTVAVGPVETTMTLQPALHGSTVVQVAPLGTAEFDTHAGPLRVLVTVDAINAEAAQALFNDPVLLSGVEERIIGDVRHGVLILFVRALASATIGALLLGFLALRPRRHGIAAGVVAVATVAGSAGVAVVTLDESSIVEPTYTGLLVGASAFVGDAQTIAANVEDYREGLASLVANVSQLYDVTSTLETYEPNDDVTRVLHISDLHVNPTSWPIIRSVVDQFGIDVVVDTGDIVHQGTAVESAYVREISTVGVPYVFVKGNHDSSATVLAVENEPNAVVLDGEVEEVAGLRFLGVADPRFTPDKSRADEQDAAEIARAEEVVDQFGDDEDIDVALMHNPVGARGLDGLAPYVLCGHMHSRAREVLPTGSWLFQQGSTGASGPNALKGEEPTPITMTVLYFDSTSSELEAWDDITLGGLGLASAEIERRLASSFVESADGLDEPPPATPIQTPDDSPGEQPTLVVPDVRRTGTP